MANIMQHSTSVLPNVITQIPLYLIYLYIHENVQSVELWMCFILAAIMDDIEIDNGAAQAAAHALSCLVQCSPLNSLPNQSRHHHTRQREANGVHRLA